MANPFSSVEYNGESFFKPFSPNTPKSEMRVPESAPFTDGRRLLVPNQSPSYRSPFDSIADRLNANPIGNLSPYCVERNGNEITIRRPHSMSDEDAHRIYGSSTVAPKDVEKIVGRLKDDGILRPSKLKEEGTDDNLD